MRRNYIRTIAAVALASALVLSGGCNGNKKDADVTESAVVETETESVTSQDIASSEATTENRFATAEHEIGEGPTAEATTAVPDTSAEATLPVETSEQAATDPVATDPVQTETTAFVPEAGKHIVALDPGHGGSNPGAIRNGYREADLTLKVGLYARDYLETYYGDSIQVFMTRTTDTDYSTNQHDDLLARVDTAAANGAEIYVSLHFNVTGTDDNSVTGALAMVSKQPWVKDQCALLANDILDQLHLLGIDNDGLTYRDSDTYFDSTTGEAMDYYAINRNAAADGIPGIIIEHVFIDNPAEIQYVDSEDDLYNMGAADAKGIAAYFGL